PLSSSTPAPAARQRASHSPAGSPASHGRQPLPTNWSSRWAAQPPASTWSILSTTPPGNWTAREPTAPSNGLRFPDLPRCFACHPTPKKGRGLLLIPLFPSFLLVILLVRA